MGPTIVWTPSSCPSCSLRLYWTSYPSNKFIL